MAMADRIKLRRKELGLTQEDLARKCDLTLATVGTFERGVKDNPRLDTLVKLADGLGLSLDELIGRKPPESAKPKLSK